MNKTDMMRAKGEATLALWEAGVAVRKSSLRRQFPDASEAEIEERLRAWLRRAGDEVPGDAAGRIRVRDSVA